MLRVDRIKCPLIVISHETQVLIDPSTKSQESAGGDGYTSGNVDKVSSY